MINFLRKTRSPVVDAETLSPPRPLAEHAVELLGEAARIQPENPDLTVEERAVWQPDSWLLQQCWQALADAGAGEEALSVAALMELRNPLWPVQALHRVAQQVGHYPELTALVARELKQLQLKLFSPWVVSDDTRQTHRLLMAAACAAAIGDYNLAFGCLERLDQVEHGWDRVFAYAELRTVLAETIAQVGLHPLTTYLITSAIRRYEDAGAQFLHEIMAETAAQIVTGQTPKRIARLMARCTETFNYATLINLSSRRMAAVAFGQMGEVDEVLKQMTTIGNVQEARRDSGLFAGKSDPHFLRQVKRPTANADVDFQVHTLQEAIRAMPIRQITREQRIALADQLALLAVRSDGWTAAGATATLIDLGALKYAVDVVDHIHPHDPTRSEGVITLVRRLLAFGDAHLADEQVSKALTWLRTLGKRNPERATIWGLAEVYLDFGRPDMALKLLDYRYTAPGLNDRMRRFFQGTLLSDDELRDNRLRMQAMIQQSGGWSKDVQLLFDQLMTSAPRLLEGEALVNFYLDGLLRPLIATGKLDQLWRLLPQVRQALGASSGDKHAVHIRRVAMLLADQLMSAQSAAAMDAGYDDNGVAADEAGTEADSTVVDLATLRVNLRQFLLELWQADAARGIWQIVHSIEGSLELLCVLEGSQALVMIAHAAANDGSLWTPIWTPRERVRE